MQSLDRLLRDIRYALRSLRKCPVLAAAVILIVALVTVPTFNVALSSQGSRLNEVYYQDDKLRLYVLEVTTIDVGGRRHAAHDLVGMAFHKRYQCLAHE